MLHIPNVCQGHHQGKNWSVFIFASCTYNGRQHDWANELWKLLSSGKTQKVNFENYIQQLAHFAHICSAMFFLFFFLEKCCNLFFVFDKIDLNTSVFVLCSLVKVQVSGERLDSLEMPGHQVMFRFLPKFQKFISGELNIKDFLQLSGSYCLHMKCCVM